MILKSDKFNIRNDKLDKKNIKAFGGGNFVGEEKKGEEKEAGKVIKKVKQEPYYPKLGEILPFDSSQLYYQDLNTWDNPSNKFEIYDDRSNPIIINRANKYRDNYSEGNVAIPRGEYTRQMYSGEFNFPKPYDVKESNEVIGYIDPIRKNAGNLKYTGKVPVTPAMIKYYSENVPGFGKAHSNLVQYYNNYATHKKINPIGTMPSGPTATTGNLTKFAVSVGGKSIPLSPVSGKKYNYRAIYNNMKYNYNPNTGIYYKEKITGSQHGGSILRKRERLGYCDGNPQPQGGNRILKKDRLGYCDGHPNPQGRGLGRKNSIIAGQKGEDLDEKTAKEKAYDKEMAEQKAKLEDAPGIWDDAWWLKERAKAVDAGGHAKHLGSWSPEIEDLYALNSEYFRNLGIKETTLGIIFRNDPEMLKEVLDAYRLSNYRNQKIIKNPFAPVSSTYVKTNYPQATRDYTIVGPPRAKFHKTSTPNIINWNNK